MLLYCVFVPALAGLVCYILAKPLARVAAIISLASAVLTFVLCVRLPGMKPGTAYTLTWLQLGSFDVSMALRVGSLSGFAAAFVGLMSVEDFETNVNYARILRIRRDREGALRLYERAYGQWPDYPMLAAEYGSLLYEVGSRKEAEEMLLHAISLGRKREIIIACKLMSRIAFETGRRSEAVRWIERALEVVPGDPDLLGTLKQLREMSQIDLEE